MGLPITAAITGVAISPLGSPTFTLTSDVAPGSNVLAYLVTAQGGTGGSGLVHTNAAPWNVQIKRPQTIKTVRDITRTSSGAAVKVPANNYSVVQKRFVLFTATEWAPAQVSTQIVYPAGADAIAPTMLAEMLSLQVGLLTAKIAELKALVTTGSMG